MSKSILDDFSKPESSGITPHAFKKIRLSSKGDDLASITSTYSTAAATTADSNNCNRQTAAEATRIQQKQHYELPLLAKFVSSHSTFVSTSTLSHVPNSSKRYFTVVEKKNKQKLSKMKKTNRFHVIV